jgi:hypothetical protein
VAARKRGVTPFGRASAACTAFACGEIGLFVRARIIQVWTHCFFLQAFP